MLGLTRQGVYAAGKHPTGRLLLWTFVRSTDTIPPRTTTEIVVDFGWQDEPLKAEAWRRYPDTGQLIGEADERLAQPTAARDRATSTREPRHR